MQKKLIALALASLAGSAFAQSQVTVYGVADVTYDVAGARNGTSSLDSRVSANSSYIGFKGAEDLGNGLKAVFQFENGINNDAPNATNTTMMGGMRDTFVGLSSGAGTVVAGNLTAAARALGAKVDVNSGATGVGYQAALFGRSAVGTTNGARTGVDDRTANAVAYVSPNFSGFSGLIAWGAGSETKEATVVGASRTDNVYSLGLNYENGPFYVGYAYTQVDGQANTLGVRNSTKAQSNRVGGYFKFGTAQIGALWDRTDANKNVDGGARNVWQLNGKVGIGAGNIIAGYGQATDAGGVNDSGAKHYFVGYEHSLSKRTILKAVYAEVKNDTNASYNFYNGSTGEIANGFVAGSDPRALQLGIRHSF